MAATMNEHDSHELAGELAEKLTQLTGLYFKEGYTTWAKQIVILGYEHEEGADITRIEFNGSTWLDVWRSLASAYQTIDAIRYINTYYKDKQ